TTAGRRSPTTSQGRVLRNHATRGAGPVRKRTTTSTFAIAVLVAAVALLAASVAVSAPRATPQKLANLNIAWFLAGTNNTYVQTRDVYTKWLDYIFSHNPNGRIAFLTGPNLNYNTNNFEWALKRELPKYPKVKIVADQRTDYTTNTAFQASQDILQAHSDVDV